MMFDKGWREENVELSFTGYTVSVLPDEAF
jgi:hypothetical protein